MTSTTHTVIRYAADGHAGEYDPAGTHTDGRVAGRGLTLADARALCRRLVGGRSHGRWYPGGEEYDGSWAGAVEAWHESRRQGCGGWVIIADQP